MEKPARRGRFVPAALGSSRAAHYLAGMYQTIHRRLRDWRDRAIRQGQYRPVYAHVLTVAHLEGRLIADDHPSWERIRAAIRAARAGDPDAIDTIEREIARLKD